MVVLEREISKVILALPTKYEHVEIFEQTVIGGFSSVNTRLVFDSQILLTNLTDQANLENNSMNKNFNHKIVYNLKLNNDKVKKRIITKILKLDDNNQYGNGMSKPLPTDWIKGNKDISWETFNFLPESVSFDNKIGYLHILDIEFDVKNATEREYAYNEIYLPIIEKQKQLILMKDPFFNYLKNLLRAKKTQRLIKRLLKLMQILFKIFFYRCI